MSDRLKAQALALVVLALFAAYARAQGTQTDVGRDIAQGLCASCHAIGRAERSPNPTAPAFRHIEPRVDLTELIVRLQDGLIAGHPEMPVFKLNEPQARALVAYMRSIQSDRTN